MTNDLYTVIIVLLTVMFFISGIDKFSNVSKVAVGLQKRLSNQFPFSFLTLVIFAAATLETIAPSIMIYSAYTGKKRDLATLSALALVGFTILATLIYHWPPTGKT